MDDEKDENAEEETETAGDAAKLEPLPDDLRETVESFVETTRLACELVPDQSDDGGELRGDHAAGLRARAGPVR